MFARALGWTYGFFRNRYTVNCYQKINEQYCLPEGDSSVSGK